MSKSEQEQAEHEELGGLKHMVSLFGMTNGLSASITVMCVNVFNFRMSSTFLESV